MKRRLKIYSSGLFISFLGSLPFGSLNITAFQITASQTTKAALIFSAAAILVELIIVRLSLNFTDKLKIGSKLFNYLMPVTISLLLFLAVSNFHSATNASNVEFSKTPFPLIQSPFLLGLLMSALNPMHLPFWASWNTVLIAKNTLDKQPGMFSFYIFGIAIGSVAGFLIFIFAGRLIFENYTKYSALISWIMGLFYLGFALYLMFPFLKIARLKLLEINREERK
ncbi:MAG: LysE family transporter [bacterium]|nr:LysE family transporter [bacterium]